MSQFKRLSKRTVLLSVLSVSLPVSATAFLLLEGSHEIALEEVRSEKLLSTGPEQGEAAAEPEYEPIPKPRTEGPVVEVKTQETARVALETDRPLRERYLSLRKLEKADPAAAVAEAEEIVRQAGTSKKGRFMAVNALGALSRIEGGKPVLARLARTGPSEEIRRTARALLKRR